MSLHVGGRGPGHLVRTGAFAPGALVALDFQLQEYRVGFGSYYIRDLNALTGWSFTRASTGYAQNSAGVLISFGSGVPRLTDLGLLIEESRTNLALWSQDPTNAIWQKIGATAANNTTIAPDGTLTGGTITASAGTGFHYTNQSVTFTAAANTHSFFVKRNNNDWIFFTVSDSEIGYFNLATGAFGTLAGGMTTISQALANGWYKISVTFTETAKTAGGLGIGPAGSNGGASFTASGTEAIYVWNRQFETAPFSSSSILTTSSAATRAADVASIGGIPVTSNLTIAVTALWGPSTGAFRVFAEGGQAAIKGFTFSDDSSHTVPRIIMRHGATPADTASNASVPASSATVVKMATSTDGAVSSFAVNGASVTSTAGSEVDWDGYLNIGSRNGGGSQANTYIQQIRMYPSVQSVTGVTQ